MNFIISNTEYEYLLNEAFVNDKFKTKIKTNNIINKNKVSIEIDQNDLDELYEMLANELTSSDFDKNHEVTKDGKIIESLIDKITDLEG